QPPIASKWQSPLIGSQLSCVQASLSLHTAPSCVWQRPVPVSQVSTPVHASWSSQSASVRQQPGMLSLTHAPCPLLASGSQALAVQTTPSSHAGAGTTVSQPPSTQASSPSQN